MDKFVELLESPDVCSLFFVALVLCYGGQLFATRRPQLRALGFRVAGIASVAYVIWGLTQIDVTAALLVAGLAFRGSLAFLLVLGAAWILLAIAAPVFDSCQRGVARARRAVLERKSERDDRRRERERAKRAEADRREWERQAPQRERQAREADAKRREDEAERKRQMALAQTDQHRRETARFECQLLYDQLEPAGQERFPRPQLASYFETYLNDGRSAHEVERRADELKRMLGEALGAGSKRSRPFQSLQEIAVAFQARREELRTLGYETDVLEALTTSMNELEDAAVREFLKP